MPNWNCIKQETKIEKDKKIMIFEPTFQFNKTFLSKFFDSSLDTRRRDKGNFKHSFHDILLVVLVGVICGINEYKLISRFAKNELPWLKKYGDFTNGIPSHETLRRFMVALDPIAFQRCYTNWIHSLCNINSVETSFSDYHFENRGENILTKETLLAIGDKYEDQIAAEKARKKNNAQADEDCS